MQRKIVTFKVMLKPADDAGPALYLGADPELAAVPEGAAVELRAYLSTTTPERILAKDRMARLAAGPGATDAQATRAWMELKAAADSMWARLRGEALDAHAALNPASPPAAGLPTPGVVVQPRAQAPEDVDAIVQRYLATRVDDALSEAWQQANATVEEVQALGTLSVVVVGPAPYDRLHEIPVPPQRLGAIWGAYETARQDYVLGKEQPSGS